MLAEMTRRVLPARCAARARITSLLMVTSCCSDLTCNLGQHATLAVLFCVRVPHFRLLSVLVRLLREQSVNV
jgi:hypothetical protein